MTDCGLNRRQKFQRGVAHRVGLVAFLSAFVSIVSCSQRDAGPSKGVEVEKPLVYVAGKGIHVFRLDVERGTLSPQSAFPDAGGYFLDFHPNRTHMYAIGGGKINAYSIQPDTGALTAVNSVQPAGQGPCHLTVDNYGRNVLAANYSDGSVVVVRIEADGRLGEQTAYERHEGSSVNKSRQEAPHAHSIMLDPSNRFAFSADLGIDKVMIYEFDAKSGRLKLNDPPSASVAPGAGPRHFAFHPSARFAYVINELDSTVTTFRYDADAGVLSGQTPPISTVPQGFEGDNYPAEVLVHPSGRFLYGTNRGHGSVAAFEIDQEDGSLATIEIQATGGKRVQNIGIEPKGRYLLAANEDTDTVAVFKIDQETGELHPTKTDVRVPQPACIRFLDG